MGSLVTIRNDGPDPVALLLAGQYQRLIPPGQQCVFSVNCELSFEPVRRLTRQEQADHSGVELPPEQPLGRYAEE